MWCHSCICLEGQRKFTDDTYEDKPFLIPDLNSASSWYKAKVPFLYWNFLFCVGLIWILCHVINTWCLSLGKCLSCLVQNLLFQETRCSFDVGLLLSAFAVFCYMLDAKLFPHRQLINHGEHFFSIMKTLSSAFVRVSQSTQSASTIKTIDSGVRLTEWYSSTVCREIMEWWFLHTYFTFMVCCVCIHLKYRH